MAGQDVMVIIGNRTTERGGAASGINTSRAARREEWNDFPVSKTPAARALIEFKRPQRPFGSTRVVGGGYGLPRVTIFETRGGTDPISMRLLEHNLKAMGILSPDFHIVYPEGDIK